MEVSTRADVLPFFLLFLVLLMFFLLLFVLLVFRGFGGRLRTFASYINCEPRFQLWRFVLLFTWLLSPLCLPR